MDVSLYHALNGLVGHGIWIDRTIRWIATYFSIVIAFVLGIAWCWPGTSEARGERQRLIIYAVAATLIGLGIAQIIGHFWFRDRPYVHHSAHLLLGLSADPSFPSDHAIGGFGLAAPFIFARHRLGPFLLTMALLLALSRVTAGTHYPSDVAAGALIGMAAAWLVWTYRRLIEPLMVPCLGLARKLRLA